MHATAPTAPEPLRRPTACLTERGHCALAIVRLHDQLAALDAADRAYCLELLALELADLTPRPEA